MSDLYKVVELEENFTKFISIIDGIIIEKNINKNLKEILSVNDIISDETLLTLEKI